jgi:hypothetical protein
MLLSYSKMAKIDNVSESNELSNFLRKYDIM